MGAVVDRLLPTLTLAKVKKWLKVDDDYDDDLITDLIEEICQKADDYLNNPFEDSSGAELPIPASVRVWVKREITKNYERRSNTVAKDEVSELGRQEWLDDNNWAVEEWGELRLLRINPGF